MTRDLVIVSQRGLTVGDLSAAVAAVHQGMPWTVVDRGDRLAVHHCDQPLIEASPSQRLDDWAEVAELFPDGTKVLSPAWCTTLTVAQDADLALGIEVARAAAWQTDGELAMLQP
ncbi:hypothetical protein [Micropruina sp.]|uniref:hypothetical protein n=1 Tax=Micropruina sp. TaxID=2737536 RepID=UPI0039E6D15B